MRTFWYVLPLFLLISACAEHKTKEAENMPANQGVYQSAGAIYLDRCDSLRLRCKQMDEVLQKEQDVVITTANEAIHAFTGFAFYCVSDTMSPVYLIKTAQVARVINNIPQAKVALDRCIDTYPSFKDRAAAIFLLAQLYDEATYLKGEREARKWYQKILDEYPKSEWALAAASAMKLLGKTDEQIVQEFLKKNQK